MNKIFSKRLKKLRFDREISQENLAKALDTTQSKISKWENGNLEPDMETFIKIALFFAVSTDYLYGLDDEFKKPKKYKKDIV